MNVNTHYDFFIIHCLYGTGEKWVLCRFTADMNVHFIGNFHKMEELWIVSEKFVNGGTKSLKPHRNSQAANYKTFPHYHKQLLTKIRLELLPLLLS